MYKKFIRTERLKRRLFFFIGLVLLFCNFSLLGQTVHSLEKAEYLKSMEDTPPQEFLENAKACRSFAINPVLQNAMTVSVGDTIDFQLFEKKNYKAVVSGSYTNVNGNFTLILTLPDYPMARGIITTNKTGKSLFSLSIPEQNQEFISKGSLYSPTDFLIEMDENTEMELKNDVIEVPEEPPAEPAEEDIHKEEGRIIEKDADINPCLWDTTLKGTDPAIIDLLIVYTPAAEAWAATNQNGIDNVIAAAMAKTAEVVANQKDGDTIRLVHTALVNYTETTATPDLGRLRAISDGYMDEVHQWRKEYNADIVALFGMYSGVGGVSYALSNTTKGLYASAFNVCRVQQVHIGYTSAHEIGHNLGLSHNAEQLPAVVLYPYAYGWHWIGNDSKPYGTVMSYIGTRVPYFSNPNELYNGVPTGNDTANNAQVFRNTKHIIAFYSEILHNLPDKPDNVVVSNPTDNGATVSWDACKNATSYRVYTTTSTSYTYWNAANSSYTLNSTTRFQPCNTYKIWVAALNDCGETRGDTITFTTKCPDDPTVITLFATDTIQLFPNPVTNELFITSELKIDKVEFYTLSGTLLMTENNFKGKISLSDLASGVYMLKVYTEKGVVVSRIVKE